MFELKPYPNRESRWKRFKFSSWFTQRLFVCNCLKLCKPLVPHYDSTAGLDGFPPARGGACSAVLLSTCLALRAHSQIYNSLLGHRHCVKACPCPVMGFMPPLTWSYFCQQLGPALSKHIFIPSLVSVLEKFLEGDVTLEKAVPITMCLCHMFVIHKWPSTRLCRCHLWCAMPNLPEDLW